MSMPILVAPCNGGQYVLDTDASDTALGAVLQQEQNGKLHVIGYASRTLTASEARYCITRCLWDGRSPRLCRWRLMTVLVGHPVKLLLLRRDSRPHHWLCRWPSMTALCLLLARVLLRRVVRAWPPRRQAHHTPG